MASAMEEERVEEEEVEVATPTSPSSAEATTMEALLPFSVLLLPHRAERSRADLSGSSSR